MLQCSSQQVPRSTTTCPDEKTVFQVDLLSSKNLNRPVLTKVDVNVSVVVKEGVVAVEEVGAMLKELVVRLADVVVVATERSEF